MWRVVVSIVLFGCGERATPVEPVAPSAPALEAPAPVADPPVEVTPIGWDHLPVDPDPSARAANGDALRIHGHALGASEEEARRVYEGSAIAFQRVADAHPDYLNARFNQACALARLGRHDEAIDILRTLVTLDLPSFGPRIDSDPDLASLAEAPAFFGLQQEREALRVRYLAALEVGVPVVQVTPEEILPAMRDDEGETHRTVYQAGVWLASERRFVPMAPRTVRAVDDLLANLDLTAIAVDRARGAVLEFLGTGTWSEGGGPIDQGAFYVFDAATGRVRAQLDMRRPSATWEPPIAAHATESGAAMRFVRENRAGDFPTITEGAFDETVRPSIAVTLAHASVLLPHGAPPDGVVLDGDALVRGDARVALPRQHHAARSTVRTATWVPRDDRSAWLMTAVIEQVEWDSMRPGPVALSVVALGDDTITVTLLEHVAAGVGALLAAPDGTAYAQLGPRVVHLTPDGLGETLPEGLYLLPPRPGAY